MDSYNEVLMEDLIDYNVDETIEFPHSSWTEQALDLFISILKNVKRDNYSGRREMLEVITIKMNERSYKFSIDQIEGKYNSLKKMYTEKMERNQTVEPELSKLFGDKANSPALQQMQETPPAKKSKLDITDDSIQSPDKAESIEATHEDTEEKKLLWSTEATKMFLDLLEELRPQLGSKLRTKKQMWEEICRRLKTHGFTFTYPQVENKWKALLRHYRGRLELMRNGSTTRFGLAHNYSSWPEFFGSTKQTIKDTESDISFANDQKLPYEDDGYTDEEPYQFEEVCQLPDVEIISDEMDPVMIEDVKPTKQQLKAKVASSDESFKHIEDGLPQLDKIISEIENFREDNRKHQNELLLLKKIELKSYRERTAQFTRIADGFSELMGYLKRKSSDDNI